MGHIISGFSSEETAMKMQLRMVGLILILSVSVGSELGSARSEQYQQVDFHSVMNLVDSALSVSPVMEQSQSHL